MLASGLSFRPAQVISFAREEQKDITIFAKELWQAIEGSNQRTFAGSAPLPIQEHELRELEKIVLHKLGLKENSNKMLIDGDHVASVFQNFLDKYPEQIDEMLKLGAVNVNNINELMSFIESDWKLTLANPGRETTKEFIELALIYNVIAAIANYSGIKNLLIR